MFRGMQNTSKLRSAEATNPGRANTKNGGDHYATPKVACRILKKTTCIAGGIDNALKERTKIYNVNILGQWGGVLFASCFCRSLNPLT